MCIEIALRSRNSYVLFNVFQNSDYVPIYYDRAPVYWNLKNFLNHRLFWPPFIRQLRVLK